MQRKVVIDAGPIIALFDKDDKFHRNAVAFIKDFNGELIANYAVVTEAMHLLDFSTRAQMDFLQWMVDGGITMAEISFEDMGRVIELMEKYADLPGDFTDATLIALCERLKIKEIASVDKDFTIYRMKNKQGFRNVFFS